MPEESRQDFYLYIDEFQNFSTDIFPSILSEARKYRLNLNLAHQYLYQLPDSIKHAVFGNVGSVISFRVGSYDAKELAEEMKPVFTSEDLEHLDNHHIALRLLIDGKMSHAFSAITMPPLKLTGYEAERDTVLRISRERYATPRDIVEEKLKIGLKNNFLGLTALSFIFQSRFIPPPQRAKRNSRTGEKAEPPKREPATFHGATDC